jgi:hypothetical protein
MGLGHGRGVERERWGRCRVSGAAGRVTGRRVKAHDSEGVSVVTRSWRREGERGSRTATGEAEEAEEVVEKHDSVEATPVPGLRLVSLVECSLTSDPGGNWRKMRSPCSRGVLRASVRSIGVPAEDEDAGEDSEAENGW